LVKRCPVTLVSGRDLKDLKRKVGLDELAYLGSGGFEIIGPYGHYIEGRGDDFIPSLDHAEADLRYAIGGVRGALVERRRFAVALHHRLVDAPNLPRVEEIFDTVARQHPELRAVRVKRAFELRPDMDWDRGRAVGLVVNMLRLKHAVPLYIGDDTTDEAAFRAIGERGVTVLVTEDERETAAQYVLSNVQEVQQLLEQLIDELAER
jgi:trehalose-phosphatase